MNKLRTLLFIFMMLSATILQAEASVFSKALGKAKSVMQSAFQMSFLPNLPVIFYKDTFNTMFDYTQRSIDEMNLEYNGQKVTSTEFQSDKALHIKKSAELALHIKSLVGSAYLAYGITLAIGGLKEIIDSSFLNPNGSRSKEDFQADIVGAKAVFGKKSFDKALNKYIGSFVNIPPATSTVQPVETNKATNTSTIDTTEKVENPFSNKSVYLPKVTNTDTELGKATEKQKLLQQYYKAVEQGDTTTVKAIGARLQSL